MSIRDAVKQAYVCAKARGWNTIYIAVDIHNTVADSNYKNLMPELIEKAKVSIQKINKFFPEITLILWSSCYKEDYSKYMDYFRLNDMQFKYFNCNPEVENTKTGDFSIKFYFNILVEDKAGFVEDDWKDLIKAISDYRYLLIKEDSLYEKVKGFIKGSSV